MTLHASAWTGWKISRYIFAGHDVPRQQSAALEPLIDTCGIDLLDAVHSILRVIGIARPLGTGSCSFDRTRIWVKWDQCARGLLDETWEVL